MSDVSDVIVVGHKDGTLANVLWKGLESVASLVASGDVPIDPFVGDLGASPALFRDEVAEAYLSGVLASWFEQRREVVGWWSDAWLVNEVSREKRVYGVRYAVSHADTNVVLHGYFGRTSLDRCVPRKTSLVGDVTFIDVARQLYGCAARLSGEGARRELFENLADTLPGYVVVLRVARLTNFGNSLLKKA